MICLANHGRRRCRLRDGVRERSYATEESRTFGVRDPSLGSHRPDTCTERKYGVSFGRVTYPVIYG
jgi:hypothetical protein